MTDSTFSRQQHSSKLTASDCEFGICNNSLEVIYYDNKLGYF